MECCSKISDYFAEFMHADSVAMQSVWFHLLDKLQTAAILPHYYWLPDEPSCDHAQAFEKDFAHFKENLNVLTSPRPDASLEPVISASHLTDARHNLSHMGNKEGLKRWQQFLYKGSPGFAVPETDRVYSNAELGSVSNSKDAVELEAQIPWVGLALIDRHTARLRRGVEATLEVRSPLQGRTSLAHQHRMNQMPLSKQVHWTSLTQRYAPLPNCCFFQIANL
jgi:hypothetical protein